VESYEGNWVLDKRHGHGEWRSSNGDVYVVSVQVQESVSVL